MLRIILSCLAVTAVAANLAFASTMATTMGKNDPVGLKWKARQIHIAVSTSLTQSNANIKADADVMGALQRSVNSWESVANVEFQIDVSDKQNVSPAGAAGDGISLITVAQTPENIALFAQDPEGDSAKTRVFYNGRGAITEADVVLNPFQQFSTDGTFGTFDLQSTLTHEIGHLLGLKHSGVIGATMSESLSKNGTFGVPDLEARNLSDSDIAAIRDLYGSSTEAEGCCSSFSGHLVGIAARNPRSVRLWAENARTGQVVANTDVSADGTFRVGGLPQANYSLFWQAIDENGESAGGVLGTSEELGAEPAIVNEKVSYRTSDVSLDFIGVNGQVADTAVSLTPGQAYILYLGGRNLDEKNTKIEISSPFFKIVPGTLFRHDPGKNSSVVSFAVFVSADAPDGLYTVTAAGKNGLRSSLVGALRLHR